MNPLKVYEIKTTRDNLICVGRMAVKSIIDRSCFEGLHDRSSEVTNFCSILEHILTFRMKGFSSASLFAVDSKRHPWVFIRETCRSFPDSCVPVIEKMENLKGNFAKLRGWIKMAMLQKRLGAYLQHALQQASVILKHYSSGSVLQSSDFATFINTTIGLNAVDFSFDLRGEDQEHPGLVCIDYTPYLRFTASDEALLDDALECDEHLNLNPSCPWQERFIKLELKFKREAEQKFFLEDRIRQVDEQLIGREREREQFETEMKQLESVILELQVQITLLHEQYRAELTNLGGNPEVLPNLPAARGHTRPLPPSQLLHRLTPVEPTARPAVGRQEFSNLRRFSSPLNLTRLVPAPTPTPTPNDSGRVSLHSSRTNLEPSAVNLWEDEELERPPPPVRVLLFPEDEDQVREHEDEAASKAAPQVGTLKEESVPVTPDVVRRIRDGQEQGTGYYRLLTVEEGSLVGRSPAPVNVPSPETRERGDGRSADGEAREDGTRSRGTEAEAEKDDEEEDIAEAEKEDEEKDIEAEVEKEEEEDMAEAEEIEKEDKDTDAEEVENEAKEKTQSESEKEEDDEEMEKEDEKEKEKEDKEEMDKEDVGEVIVEKELNGESLTRGAKKKTDTTVADESDAKMEEEEKAAKVFSEGEEVLEGAAS